MADDLAPSEVARRLGTSTRTVQRWIEQGRLPARRVGGRWRVALDAYDAFRQAGASQPSVGGTAPTGIRILFIANRGEIATRISRTCDRLGIRAVIPPTEGPEAVDLLDAEAVVAAAVGSGADAVHPGFGFLAESADLAERVMAAGRRWVGPPPSAIRAMGDKAAARRRAAGLGVPVMPGYDAPDQSDGALAAAAERIGLPLLIKPSAGGGGKGMRVVRDLARFPQELGASRREALTAFGDDRLILERYVETGRHVEVQLLFDAAGRGVHLGERDCSIQRRHQKVLEESPAPRLAAALRRRLTDAALALGRDVGYVNAGTCEFLIDERGNPAFLEMNTRLQVEHAVTELVTGRDLVADQLRIAAGAPLDVAQRDLHVSGHAIEVRVYAEDPDDGFLPQTGRIEALRWPAGDGIRVDAGVSLGSEIGGRFDPMLAKIVAWGPDRPGALERLARALDETRILGVVTNLRFLRWLVAQPAVRDGAARTDTLERTWPPDDWATRTAIPDGAWSVAASRLIGPAVAIGETVDPWADGWRLNGDRRLRLATEGSIRTVEVPTLDVADAPDAPDAVLVGDVVHVDVLGRSVAVRLAAPPSVDRVGARAASGAGGPVDLSAPMPGAVLGVHVDVGALVEAGDPVVTLEAMKMEHVVAAAVDGIVTDITVRAADQVARGQRLATIEPPP